MAKKWRKIHTQPHHWHVHLFRTTLTRSRSHHVMKLFSTLAFGLLTAVVKGINVGDKIPSDVELHLGFPPEKINVADRIAGKKVILLGCKCSQEKSGFA